MTYSDTMTLVSPLSRMGKSRAEIQKAYRERQKAKGPEFLAKERLRVKQYWGLGPCESTKQTKTGRAQQESETSKSTFKAPKTFSTYCLVAK